MMLSLSAVLLLGLASLVHGQHVAVIGLRVYRFQAEAEEATFLKDLLPTPADGVDATGRFGVLDEQEVTRLRAELEQHGKVELLANPMFATVSGRPEAVKLIQEDETVERRQVARVDVVPIRLAGGNWRFEMRAEMNEADDPENRVKNGDDGIPVRRERWVDVATDLKPGRTMATAVMKPKAENANEHDMELTCTLFVATLNPRNTAPLR